MDSEFSDLSEAELGWDSEESLSGGHGTEDEGSTHPTLWVIRRKELSEDEELYLANAEVREKNQDHLKPEET